MIEDGILLNIIRLMVGVIILSYASYTDIKTRKAYSILWIIMGTIGVILLVVQYFTIGIEDIIYLWFIPIMIGFMLFIYYLPRTVLGGADVRALIALSFLVPIKPQIFDFPLWNSYMPYPWIIFANSVILFLFIPLSLFIYNIAKRNFRFPYALLGCKMNVKKAKKTFVWPLEKIKDGRRVLSIMPGDIDFDEEYLTFEKAGIKEIWVTPKVPFMIPLLAGFLTSFFLGDILSALIPSFS